MDLEALIQSPRAKAVLELMRTKMPNVAFEIRPHVTGQALFLAGAARGKSLEYGITVGEWLTEDLALGAFEQVSRAFVESA